MSMTGISVLILTLNEEVNLPLCLGSLAWCDDVVILDSYSTDRTQEIAEAAGVRFIQRTFDNYASQRNYGLNEVEYKNSWVFMVDADELIPDDLVKELRSIIKKGNDDINLYRLRRKDFFLGKWIKHSSGYPTWFGRLLKVGHVRVERAINEEYVTDGKIGLLDSHLYHYPFNKGFSAWLDKHNRYSTMEAELMLNGGLATTKLGALFDRDPAVRRKVVKAIVYRMPGRPIFIFIAFYFIRFGFLDGRAGLTFCLLRTFYEFMIDCKIKEYKLRSKGWGL